MGKMKPFLCELGIMAGGLKGESLGHLDPPRLSQAPFPHWTLERRLLELSLESNVDNTGYGWEWMSRQSKHGGCAAQPVSTCLACARPRVDTAGAMCGGTCLKSPILEGECRQRDAQGYSQLHSRFKVSSGLCKMA